MGDNGIHKVGGQAPCSSYTHKSSQRREPRTSGSVRKGESLFYLQRGGITKHRSPLMLAWAVVDLVVVVHCTPLQSRVQRQTPWAGTPVHALRRCLHRCRSCDNASPHSKTCLAGGCTCRDSISTQDTDERRFHINTERVKGRSTLLTVKS
jgi:hypothetical protein